MYGLYCDACGEPLLVESNVRYVARIEVFAAYDPLEITEEDLAGATRENWNALVEELAGADPDELAAQVHMSLRFDLCPPCRKRYLEDPIRSARSRGAGEDGAVQSP